jgi:hypothetical protein
VLRHITYKKLAGLQHKVKQGLARIDRCEFGLAIINELGYSFKKCQRTTRLFAQVIKRVQAPRRLNADGSGAYLALH